MLEFQNEIFVRNLILIIAAGIGFFFLIGFYFHNCVSYFLPFGRRRGDIKKYSEKNFFDSDSNSDWIVVGSVKNYSAAFDQSFIVWDISAFKIKMDRWEKLFSHKDDFPWFDFSHSQHECEKIMLPILKKIRSKYVGKFEQVNPIHVSRIEKGNLHLYTWLRNENHIHSVIFNFLDEILNLAHEANVYPSLSILWSDSILMEVFLPLHSGFQNIESAIKDIFGVEYKKEKNRIKFTLWLAFTNETVPNSLMKKYHSTRKPYAVNQENLKKAS